MGKRIEDMSQIELREEIRLEEKSANKRIMEAMKSEEAIGLTTRRDELDDDLIDIESEIESISERLYEITKEARGERLERLKAAEANAPKLKPHPWDEHKKD